MMTSDLLRTFSRGMVQRLAIARVLLLKPAVVMMDEPTAMLDHANRTQVIGALRRVCAKHTVLIVTHSLTEAVFLGDRVWIITPAPGRIGREFSTEIPDTRNVDPLSVQETKAFKDVVAEVARSFREIEGKGR